jgi:hypothetical protein
MTQPRLRRVLDAGRLVPAERHAVTGRLTDHAREHKHQRTRTRSLRHVLRTPAGAVGAAVVIAAAVIGTVLATSGGGTSTTDPAKAAAERAARAAGQPVPPVGTVLPTGAAPSPPVLPASQLDPCDVLTIEQALRTLGEPVRRGDNDPEGTCTWFARNNAAGAGSSWVAFHWLRGTLDEKRQTAVEQGLRITDHPELGPGGFSYPPVVVEAPGGGRTFTGASASALLVEFPASVDVGHSTHDSHAADPVGDEQAAVDLMRRLLDEAGAGLGVAVGGS